MGFEGEKLKLSAHQEWLKKLWKMVRGVMIKLYKICGLV